LKASYSAGHLIVREGWAVAVGAGLSVGAGLMVGGALQSIAHSDRHWMYDSTCAWHAPHSQASRPRHVPALSSAHVAGARSPQYWMTQDSHAPRVTPALDWPEEKQPERAKRRKATRKH
jgi:hypothetical protein